MSLKKPTLRNSIAQRFLLFLTMILTIMNCDKHNLIWLDLEMTGLEPAQDFILEIATIVTDSELNILAEGSAGNSPTGCGFRRNG